MDEWTKNKLQDLHEALEYYESIGDQEQVDEIMYLILELENDD